MRITGQNKVYSVLAMGLAGVLYGAVWGALLTGCTDPDPHPLPAEDAQLADTGATTDTVADSTTSSDTSEITDIAAWQGTPVASVFGSEDPGTWAPKKVYGLSAKVANRGYVDLRGLIHAHSPYSHDACDGHGFDAKGNIDQECWDDFRKDFCTVAHDFVFLTDHPSHMAEHETPGTLLYDKALGDELIERDGVQVANRTTCKTGMVGKKQLIMMGAESNASMPVGLPGHITTDVAGRKKAYGTADKATFDALHKHGALILYAHTESVTLSDLIDLPTDGFEMYNLHANMVAKMKEAAKLAAALLNPKEGEKQPNADLILLPLLFEDNEYATRWGTTLAAGKHRTTTMGTDCHRNSLPFILGDNERVDSYRRMMIWFSNHLLVKPEKDGTWDDRHLKEALGAGRLYGAFEVLGYPDRFAFVATSGDAASGKIAEMGDQVALADKPVLRVSLPSLRGLDATAEAPIITARLLKARKDGFDVVATSAGDLAFAVKEAGAYRAEVRIVPKHLRGELAFWGEQADREFAWVYSNAIYVTDDGFKVTE